MFGENGSHQFAGNLFDQVAVAPDLRSIILEHREKAVELSAALAASLDRYELCIQILTEDLCSDNTISHGRVHKLVNRLGGLVADCNAGIAEGKVWIDRADAEIEKMNREDGSMKDYDSDNPSF